MSKSAQACLGITWQLKAISLSFVNSGHGGLWSAMAVDIVIYGGQCHEVLLRLLPVRCRRFDASDRGSSDEAS